MSFSDAMGDAVQEVLRTHSEDPSDQGVVTAWVVIAETMGTDGRAYLGHHHSGETPPWKIIGMMQFITNAVNEALLYGPPGDDEEDE